MKGISDRQFVITGAVGGIGSACARQLYDLGAYVLLVDVDAGRLENVSEKLAGGSRITTHVSSLASPRRAADALDAAGHPVV